MGRQVPATMFQGVCPVFISRNSTACSGFGDWQHLESSARSRKATALFFLAVLLVMVQFQDKAGSSQRYTGIDQWCDADYNSHPPRNIAPGPCLDMSIFVCEPLNQKLPPGVRAAIAVAAFVFVVIVLGMVAYFVLAKASNFRRYLALARIRLKGAPRSGRMSLVVTDIEGYSGVLPAQQRMPGCILYLQGAYCTFRVSSAHVKLAVAHWLVKSPAHMCMLGLQCTDAILCVLPALQTSSGALLRSCSRPWCCTTLC